MNKKIKKNVMSNKNVAVYLLLPHVFFSGMNVELQKKKKNQIIFTHVFQKKNHYFYPRFPIQFIARE